MSKLLENSEFRKMNEKVKEVMMDFELARIQNLDQMYVLGTQA